jgi:hypothetical protein
VSGFGHVPGGPVPEGRGGGFVPVLLVAHRAGKDTKVALIRVPAFTPMPEVVIWGARTFRRAPPEIPDDDAPDRYAECFAYWTNLTTGLDT